MDSGLDDYSCSGGTCSVSDSGFSDVSRYLKTRPMTTPKPPPVATRRLTAVANQKQSARGSRVPPIQPKPHKYTPINAEQVDHTPYYKSAAREDNRFQSKFQWISLD